MTRRIVVLTEGSFGSAVAQVITERYDQVAVYSFRSVVDRLDQIASEADFIAVALWRQYDSECERLDQACFAAGVPWSAAYLFQDTLFCGPLVVPNAGPCFSCFRRRYLTHSVAPERELALLQSYRANPDLGPAGFVPSMVGLAAHSLIRDCEADASAAGQLRTVELTTGNVLATRVIAVHGCRRCGIRPVAAGERTVHELAAKLKDILR